MELPLPGAADESKEKAGPIEPAGTTCSWCYASHVTDMDLALRARLEEYKEIGVNWRHYGEVRFKQLTVFLTMTGVLGAAAFSEPARNQLQDLRLILAAVGFLLTAFFFILEERATYYRRAYMSCAIEIEKKLNMSQYRRTENPWPIRSDSFSTVEEGLRSVGVSDPAWLRAAKPFADRNVVPRIVGADVDLSCVNSLYQAILWRVRPGEA